MTSRLENPRRGLLPARPRAPAVVLLGPEIALLPGRVHEATGPARRSFALLAARATKGPVLWIQPAWTAERLNPDGFHAIAAPGRFLFAWPRRPEDVLWTMEEALRSGLVPLVIADLPAPPPLTPVRRLQLAAEAGGQAGTAPLGILLAPGEGGAAGVESRWHMAPAHTAEATAWRLERRRARLAPPGAWMVHQERRRFRARRLTDTAPPPPERAAPAPAPG